MLHAVEVALLKSSVRKMHRDTKSLPSSRDLSYYLSLALSSCLCQNRLAQQAEEAVKLKSELQVSLFVLVFSGL